MRLKLFGLVVCVVLSGDVTFSAPKRSAVADKPNIVHILTDDLGWQDVACYYRAVHGKESVYETPNMDRIVRNGIRFMQAYSPSATCAPSRAAYMAGQYTPHTGVLHVMGSTPPRPHNPRSLYIDGFYPMRLDLGKPSIGRALQDAGYLTAHIKKWHFGGRNNGYPGPVDYGFDFSWMVGSKDYNDSDVWDKEMKGKKEYWNGLWLPLNPRHKGFATSNPEDPFRTDPNDDDRPLDGVSDLAVRWLDKAKDQGKPFFLNLCPSLVHGPISTRDRKRLEYYCEKMDVPFPTDSGRITEKEWDKQRGQVNPYYASMIDGLDWSIGKVLTFLETTDDPRNPGHKLIENTYLIVSADNGAAEGRFATKERVADNSPLRAGKSSVYEGGIRIPFMLMGPGIKPGSVSETPINLIDMFPTFMAMAGATPSDDLDLDGCNILPIMKGEADVATFTDGRMRDTLYFTLPVGRCSASVIRKGGWKLVLNHAPEVNELPGMELFKMYNADGSVNDLGEQENLVDTHPDKRKELLAELNAWLNKYEAQLPYKNPKVEPEKDTLPGADAIPAVTRRVERGNVLEVHVETGKGKSRIVDAILVYTTNGSDLLRENPAYEEWFRAPATINGGIATAIAPPGMTHGIFCLRDENGFLLRSKRVPPWHGHGGDSRWTIAKDPGDTYAWRPGLISLISTGASARKNALKEGLDVKLLDKAIRTARGVIKKPVEEASYASAMRSLRHEIRMLDVPEAKLSELNLFVSEKWSSATKRDAPGGLIIHVGADGVAEAAAQARDGRFLIHFLCRNRAAAEKASAAVVAHNLAGKATVSVFDGVHLPFVDDCVNAIHVSDAGCQVSGEEIERVLVPRGIAVGPASCIPVPAAQSGNGLVTYTKPVRSTIDDWSHNLYNAGNAGVSRDMEAGSPRHMQWTTGPQFSRSHDGNSSILSMVSAGGRVFYIMDEGSTAFLSLPSKWNLVARDAFNGKLLWRKPLPQTFLMQIGNIKSGFANLGHRMVAHEDVVYVTLGFNAPVTALDSRTGDELWTNASTGSTEELILFNGVLFCVLNLSDASRVKNPFQDMESIKRFPAADIPRKLVALDSKTGAILWQRTPPTILPLSLTAGDAGVFIHDGTSIVAMDLAGGKERWRSEPIAFYGKLEQYSGVNMVLVEDVMLYACGTAYPHKSRNHESDWKNTIIALDARSGKLLWQAPHRQDGIFTTPDLLVADGLVWHAPIDSGHSSGDYAGHDLRTGKVVREFKGDHRPQMPHHRCYRNRGTDRFLFTGWTGINIFDVNSGTWDHNFWIRGACRYGVMPANGLLYNTPSVCTCYINAKVKGFNALADHSPSRVLPKSIPEEDRLVKGEGIGANVQHRTSNIERRTKKEGEWPTYRGGVDRHGVASTALSEAYEEGWKASIGGKLTQPVIADGSVFVSAYDQHAVYALDAGSGATQWRFPAGGVVNSPPTIWKGRAIFGCNDGWVYCLSATSGKLVWKYRAAPLDRRIIAHENLESLWPVHGSVLVLEDPKTGKGRVYTAAGRSMFLDGGLRLLVLDAESGRKLNETVMNEIDPETGKNVQQGHEWPPDLPAGLPDVLSFSDNTIYMGVQPFSTDGKRRSVYYPSRGAYGVEGRDARPMTKRPSDEGIHLFSTIGFLDDSEMHRSVWMYGKDSFGGCWGFPVATFAHPSGQILSVMKDKVYGYGRQFYNEGNQQFMHLFATGKNPELVTYKERFENQAKKDRRGGPHISSQMATVPKPAWSRTTDTYVRALLAGANRDAKGPDLLCAVGFPEVIDEHDAVDLIKHQQRSGFMVDKIYEKEKAAKGELGATLVVVSADSGETLSETKLEAPAVFDGMSAAYGKLFLSDTEGNVVCLEPSERKGGAHGRGQSQLVANLEAGKKQTVVTFGTSLTRVGAWVDQLATVLGQQYPGQTQVINGAQGGANSDWGRKSLDEKVLKHKPDTVLIEFSVNDAVASRRTSVAHARGNLENMIERILKSDPACEIILMVMNPAVGHTGTARPNLKAYNQMYRDVARERGFQLIDHYPVWEKLLNEDPGRFNYYVPDMIHPVRAGALAVIIPTITRALGLEPGQPEQSTDAPCWHYLTTCLIDKPEGRDGICTQEEFNVYWNSIFDKNDASKNGQLTPDELGPAVLYDHFDTDGNRSVTRAEFLKVYAPHFEDYQRRQR